MERAHKHGLQYVGEADFSVMSVQNFPERVETMLHSVATDVIEMEQYMDFVRNRLFRQTILCRDEVTLDRTLRPERLLPLYVTSATQPETEVTDVNSEEKVTFRTAGSMTATTDPVMKAALLHLGRLWPSAVSFTELAAVAKSRAIGGAALVDTVQATPQTLRLAESLLRCYSTGHVELSVSPPKFQKDLSAKPVATPLARYQALHGASVANRRHETVHLSDMQRYLLSQLDGEHDQESLVSFVAELIEKGSLVLHNQGQAVTDQGEISRIATSAIQENLQQLAARTLLTS